jgi:hypothetical protein
MSVSLVINGNTYLFPTSGEDPNWAREVSGWATDVNLALNSITGTGDINESSFSIANNVSAAADINGLLLSGATVKAAIINYSCYRESNATPSGKSETGTILAAYDELAASGSLWLISQQVSGDASIVISITDTGQFQYLSSDITAAGYSGTMVFTAKVLNR